MNVSLTPQLEKMVKQKVASGRYGSASEVIREALRLMERQQAERAQRLKEIRREIQVGLDQARRGELLDGEKVFREMEEQIARRGAKR